MAKDKETENEQKLDEFEKITLHNLNKINITNDMRKPMFIGMIFFFFSSVIIPDDLFDNKAWKTLVVFFACFLGFSLFYFKTKKK